MKKCLLSFILAASFYLMPTESFAWGAKGHALVAEIAFHFLDDSTKLKVQKYLGNLSIEEAANWMDNSRSNSYYDYMKTWHYLDIDKGMTYKDVPAGERNILSVLYSAIADLKNMKTLKKKDITRDLYLIFHLMGDLHQPLHTGYAVDKGGNTINISSQNFSSNLHSAWDTQIIESEGISLEKCLNLYATYTPEKVDSIKKMSVMGWMNQSRSLLDTVYSFKKDFLDPQYVQNNVLVIETQLVKAGLRLAAVLNEAFNKPKQPVTVIPGINTKAEE